MTEFHRKKPVFFGIFLVLALFLLFCSVVSLAQERSQGSKNISSKTGVYVAAEPLQPQQLLNKNFEVLGSEILSFGRIKGSLWLRFTLEGLSSETEAVVFANTAALELVELYEVLEGEILPLGRKGLLHPATMAVETVVPRFHFRIPPKQRGEREFLMKIESPFSLSFSLFVANERDALTSQHRDSALLLLYLGFILCLLLFNFIFFLSTKSKTWLYYCAVLLVVHLLLPASIEGLTFSLFLKSHAELLKPFLLVLIALGWICFLSFSHHFLFSQSSTGVIRRLSQTQLVLWGIILFLIPFLDYSALIDPMNAFTIFSAVFILFQSVHAYFKRIKNSGFFICAFASIIAGISIYLGRIYGVLPANFLFGSSMLLGCTLEALFLSVAVGKRVAELRETEVKGEVERQQAERLQTVFYIVLHDLANQTNITLLTACRQLELGGTPQEDWMRVFKASLYETELLTRVREYEAIINRSESISLEKTSFNETLERALFTFNEKLQEKNISVEIFPGEGRLDFYFLAEPVTFSTSAFNNIFSNAIKFSHVGGKIRITVSEDKEFVVIQIRDYGIGIPPDILERIFDRDFKMSREGTSGEKGTGFGMPLSKVTVESQGGVLQIKSNIDKENGTLAVIQMRRAP